MGVLILLNSPILPWNFSCSGSTESPGLIVYSKLNFLTLIALSSFCLTCLFLSAWWCPHRSIHMSTPLNLPICPDISVRLMFMVSWIFLLPITLRRLFPSGQWCFYRSIHCIQMIIPLNPSICPDMCVALGQRTVPDQCFIGSWIFNRQFHWALCAEHTYFCLHNDAFAGQCMCQFPWTHSFALKLLMI